MVKSINKNSLANHDIYIIGNKIEVSGCSHYKENIKKNNDLGIQNIKVIPYHYNTINTLLESNSIYNWIQKNTNIKKIIICAPPYHILRASMTLISTLINNSCSHIKVFSISGIVNNWNEKTVTHQGLTNHSCNKVISLDPFLTKFSTSSII